MRLSTVSAALSGLVASTAALSDLDASVWKSLESGHTRRSFRRYPRNRPFKRADGWNPPSSLATALTEVWEHYESTYDGGIDGNTNWGWQQVMANDGHLNICVRWDSNQTVTAAQRTQIATVYKQQYQKWFEWVYGYNGFPYTEVGVNIVGWAVSDKSLLQGSTDDIDVYTDLDSDGIPMCAVGCSRDAHLDSDYSGCTGGADHHYDQSLWLTEGLDGGYGYSWGQQVGREYFMENIASDNIHILLHEMGHTFGLDDFYDWTPTGVSNFIMLAGSATEITDFDGWMYRNWWYKLAAEHGWGSSNSSSTESSDSSSTLTAAEVESETAVATSTESVASQVVENQEIEQPTPSSPSFPDAPVNTPVFTPIFTPIHTPVETPIFATPTPVSGEVAKWYQCGGANWKGATSCASGLKCVSQNEYYSQCL